MPRLFSAKVILYLLFLLLLDWIFLAPFRGGFFQPVLLYLVILYAGFESHWRQSARYALAVGFLRDALSTQPLGVETTVLLTATFALAFFVKKIERQSSVMRIFVGFLFVFVVNLFILVLSNLLGFAQQSLWQCFSMAGATAFSTTLFLPLFFMLSDQWFGEKIPLRQFELFR